MGEQPTRWAILDAIGQALDVGPGWDGFIQTKGRAGFFGPDLEEVDQLAFFAAWDDVFVSGRAECTLPNLGCSLSMWLVSAHPVQVSLVSRPIGGSAFPESLRALLERRQPA